MFLLNQRIILKLLKTPVVYVQSKHKKQYSVLSFIIPIGIGVSLTGLCSIIFQTIKILPPKKDAVEAVVGIYWSQNENDYVMQRVAHRGAGLDAPENSLLAFDLCCVKECQAIEFDVALTSDNIPIVFHDDTLERMANLNLAIKDSLWKELSNVDISVNHALKHKIGPVNIPTLEEAIKQILKCKNQRMFIDLKGMNLEITGIVLDIFKKYPELHLKAVVSSFYPHLIYFIRRANPNIVCSLAWRPKLFSHCSSCTEEPYAEKRSENRLVYFIFTLCDIVYDWLLQHLTYKILGMSLILLHKDSVTPEVVAKWQNKNINVVAWTVNQPEEKQYFENTLKIPYMTDTLTKKLLR